MIYEGLPFLKNGGSFHGELLNNQMVYILTPKETEQVQLITTDHDFSGTLLRSFCFWGCTIHIVDYYLYIYIYIYFFLSTGYPLVIRNYDIAISTIQHLVL